MSYNIPNRFLFVMGMPAEISIGGVLIPRFLLCAVFGFCAAYGLVRLLQQRGGSRLVWHLPLVFVSLWTIFALGLELLFHSG